MSDTQQASYGSWKSPISTDLIVAGALSLGQIVVDGHDVYWAEGRPQEKGRTVIMRRTLQGEPEEITPSSFYVRTRVHEYGGGAFTVDRGTVFFSNDYDGRLYRQEPDGEPQPISPPVDLRYADFQVDRSRNRLISVREDHTDPMREAINTVVSIPLDDPAREASIISGNDFYATPRVSPDGTRIAWLAWNHPNMPWDGTELWVGEFGEDGTLASKELVAGGQDESVVEPAWSPDGVLYFVSDHTGWWNLYRWREGQIEPLHPMEAEFTRPHWVFGRTTYSFESANRLICAYTEGGTWGLASLDTRTLEFEPLIASQASIGNYLHAIPGYLVTDFGSPTAAAAIVRMNLDNSNVTELRRSSDVEIDAGYISVAEAIEYPTENGKTAHGLFYPPANKDYTAPPSEKPPLIVIIHGGPTSQTVAAFSLSIQYWTSRGFGVLDVNYGGSTGFGTEYRRRLNGQWGIVDVDDCVNGAKYLVDRGDADGERLIIRGGSAGGFTTLNALTFRDTFQAGASYYGVSDLSAMAQDTHKFESRYLDSLVGPYPSAKEIYEERSSILHTDRLSSPIIFFQGLEDKVVPPSQTELMVEAMRRKGLPVDYVAFEGEQHGFRKSETIKRTLEAELYFYSRIFGFPLPEAVEPVEIWNVKSKE